MSREHIVRKITSGYQITIPLDFRKYNHLNIGSMVSVVDRGDKLIVEPFKNKSAALKKLEALFKNTPKYFSRISDQKISETIRTDIKTARLGRSKS